MTDQDAEPNVKAGIFEPVKDDPLTPLIQQGVQTSLDGFRKGMDAIINAALKQVGEAQSKSRKNGVPILFGEGHNGDPKKTFGDWCLAVARGDRNYLEKHYGSKFIQYQQKASLAESSGVTGGYTVPPEFYQQLMTIMAENTFIRPRAFVAPMASATLQIPYLDITTVQSAGVSPFFGGVQMYWTAEAQTRTETEPQFKQMELRAWELSGYSVSSNVLLQDSIIGLEKFLMTLFAMSLAWFEEYAFLQGNGAGKPQGMLGANAAISVNRSGGANTVVFADVATMWSQAAAHQLGQGHLDLLSQRGPPAPAVEGRRQPSDLPQIGNDPKAPSPPPPTGRCSAGRSSPRRRCPPSARRATSCCSTPASTSSAIG